jgi:hypothetical protein
VSTSVTREKPVAGPSKGLGLATAGLAIVVAIGIGFTLSQDNVASPSDVRPAHPQVSDPSREIDRIVIRRQTSSPGAGVESDQVGQGTIGVESPQPDSDLNHVLLRRLKPSGTG